MRKSIFTKTVITWVFLILALSTVEAFAGSHDHQGGFFLRLSAGPGFAQTKFGDASRPIKFSGLSGDANIAVGFVLFENFILHTTIFGCGMADPSLELGGSPLSFYGNIILISGGIGFTYYIMPLNIYFSPSIGIGKLFSELVDASGSTDMGLAFDMTLGREWWLGSSWGIGVSGALGYHRIKEMGVSENWSGINLALRFSATLN